MGSTNISEFSPTVVYPLLGGQSDLALLRLSGVGLGNAFFNYFHSVRISELNNAKTLFPAWPSIKLGPYIRGERTKRVYSRLFTPFDTEIAGYQKYLAMTCGLLTAKRVFVNPEDDAQLYPGRLNILQTTNYRFGKLALRRDLVRERYSRITKRATSPRWGGDPCIAIHVRLGDFAIATEADLFAGKKNIRAPIEWYVAALKRLREAGQDLPAIVYSDGVDAELAPLLATGARRAPKQTDIDDLTALSSASILVGSNSTFSQWAAFLGDMPSVWMETQTVPEKPTSARVPISFLRLDGSGELAIQQA